MTKILMTIAVFLFLVSCASAPSSVTANAAEVTETQSALAEAVTETVETTDQALAEAVALAESSYDCPSLDKAIQAHLITMQKLAERAEKLKTRDAAARMEAVRLLSTSSVLEKAYTKEKMEKNKVTYQRNIAIGVLAIIALLITFLVFKRLNPF